MNLSAPSFKASAFLLLVRDIAVTISAPRARAKRIAKCPNGPDES